MEENSPCNRPLFKEMKFSPTKSPATWAGLIGIYSRSTFTTITCIERCLCTRRIGTNACAPVINNNYLSVKKVSNTLPFSPIKHRNVRRESFLPCSR